MDMVINMAATIKPMGKTRMIIMAMSDQKLVSMESRSIKLNNILLHGEVILLMMHTIENMELLLKKNIAMVDMVAIMATIILQRATIITPKVPTNPTIGGTI